MLSKIVFYTVIVFATTCCKSKIISNSSRTTEESTIPVMTTLNSPKKVAIVQNTKKERTSLNSDKTLKLLLEIVSKRGDPATIFDYKVQEIVSGKILKEGVFRGTDVQWRDSTSIILIPYVGTIQQNSLSIPEDSDENQNFKSQIIKIK